jgi:hypothetical protein
MLILLLNLLPTSLKHGNARLVVRNRTTIHKLANTVAVKIQKDKIMGYGKKKGKGYGK